MIAIAFYNTIKNQYIYIRSLCVSAQHIIYIDINRFQIHIMSMDSPSSYFFFGSVFPLSIFTLKYIDMAITGTSLALSPT